MFLYGRECKNQHDLMVAILLAAGGTDAERLKPSDWPGRIGDVVFERDNWIFEVKSIEVDRTSDPNVQSKLGEIMNRDSPRFGGPIGWGKRRVNLNDLPKQTGANFMRAVGQSVQKAVDEANRQIKATRDALRMPDANGCIALIAPPHELLPQGLSWLVGDAIRGGRNSAINSALIALTPLLAPFGEFIDLSSYTACPGVGGIYVPERIKKKFGRKWAAAHGTPTRQSTIEEIDDLVQRKVRA